MIFLNISFVHQAAHPISGMRSCVLCYDLSYDLSCVSPALPSHFPMESWDHCISMLRAGAPPTDVLPNLRALFESLPTLDNESHNQAEIRPTASLHHYLDRSHPPIPIPYLRPPFFLWDLLRDADGHQPPEATVFDTELEINVLTPFKQRFVAPPHHHVHQLLDTEASWQHSLPQTPCSPHNPRSSQLPNPSVLPLKHNTENITTNQSMNPFEQLKAVANTLSNTVNMFNSYVQIGPPTFPPLNIHQWTWVVSNIDPYCKFSNQILDSLLRSINQPSFAIVVLHTLLPTIALQMNTDCLIQLINLALGIADINKYLTTAQVRHLLHVYQTISVDAWGALTQLCIVRNLHFTE